MPWTDLDRVKNAKLATEKRNTVSRLDLTLAWIFPSPIGPIVLCIYRVVGCGHALKMASCGSDCSSVETEVGSVLVPFSPRCDKPVRGSACTAQRLQQYYPSWLGWHGAGAHTWDVRE